MKSSSVGWKNILEMSWHKMKIWKNTSTLHGFDVGLSMTESKEQADVLLLGSKHVDLNSFPRLKGIFRAGVGMDNVPILEAEDKGIIVRFPSQDTIDIIYEETASFTCGLIFRMFYSNVGTLDPWFKESRRQLSTQTLLVIGTGKIGGRVVEMMDQVLNVITFDVLKNDPSDLQRFISAADCVSIHIPKTDGNISFIDAEKLSWMKNGAILVNTARGAIVDEEALYLELKSKRLKAAFDVYWREPYAGKLKEFFPDPFFMTPHVASTCKEFLDGCRKDLDSLIDELS
jgi:phosphoglycerate dehydrogenase-like enzyme